MQVPPSGRAEQPGSVTATQSTTNAGGTNSVNLINSSVNPQGAYTGSEPTGAATGSALALTLDQALTLALQHNLASITEAESVRQAQARRDVARSELLPQINTVVSETVEQINLRTLGVETSSFPLAVGPFNFFDARAASVNQSVLDLVRLRNYRSAGEQVTSSIEAQRDARDLIVLAVGGTYLELIATGSRIAAARAQVDSSQAIFKQASDRLRAGLAPLIDQTRAQVQLQTDQQRLRSLVADLDRQKLTLSRIVGLPLGQQFSIADDFPYAPLSGVTLQDSLARAMQTRADLRASEAGLRAAEDALGAAHAERYPAITLNGDYGASGLRPTADDHGVFTVTGSLVIPLYQGGRIAADSATAQSIVRQRKAEVEDIKGRIDQDVRQTFIDLSAAADQVELAQSNVGLARDTLRQSRDRFNAGIADTVEVVQAQQFVVQADNDYITAVFEHNMAKVSLARARGDAASGIRQLLQGK